MDDACELVEVACGLVDMQEVYEMVWVLVVADKLALVVADKLGLEVADKLELVVADKLVLEVA